MSDKAILPHGPAWEPLRDGFGIAFGRRLHRPGSAGWLVQHTSSAVPGGLGSMTWEPDFQAWLNAINHSQTGPDMTQVMTLLNTINNGVKNTMATLIDIKTKLDGLQASEQKLEAFAVATQASLADVKAQLATAMANASDPGAIQAIVDQVSAMQAGVEAVLPAAPAAPDAPADASANPADPAAPAAP